VKIDDSVPVPTMLKMYIIKKKNEGNFYKFQYENAQFQILASKAKEILEVNVIFNLGIIRLLRYCDITFQMKHQF
jgi:hypothetical protein